MPEYSWVRALLLILLGLGIFSIIASGWIMLTWLIAGERQPVVTDLAALLVLVTLPVAYHLWRHYGPGRHES